MAYPNWVVTDVLLWHSKRLYAGSEPGLLWFDFFLLLFLFFFKLIFQWTEYISDECAVKLTVCFHAGKVSWLQQLLAILPHSIHHFVKVLMFCSEPPRKKKEEKRMTKQPNSFIPCQKTDWSLSLFALGTINVTFSWMPY